MHLQRIQVPNFRVLKNVDITFEKDFSPRIFPLGSQNGGGKSTLLQLIFALLNCSRNERKSFIQNILRSFEVKSNNEEGKILAIIDIWDGKKTVGLEILVFSSLYVRKKYLQDINIFSSKEVSENLLKDNMIFITTYDHVNMADGYLCCRPNNIDINETDKLLEKLSQKVFLAAPSNQVFLFLPRESKKLLFTTKDIGRDQTSDYLLALTDAKSDLKGFFTYDFFALNILLTMFQNARDKDFKAVVETGKYGNNYQSMLIQLNSLLTNKTLNISYDLSSIVFKSDTNGESIELEPEDLSHGELKRLSIYMWLKYRKIEDAIVLMDEIEIAFHPDWQYRIISDLEEWTPNNQYIIATHSYHVCEALTPRHVKELEPKLLTTPSAN
jgi:predicted ATP-dependent endonuclease of OLD family